LLGTIKNPALAGLMVWRKLVPRHSGFDLLGVSRL
jgi:hypothetical protein